MSLRPASVPSSPLTEAVSDYRCRSRQSQGDRSQKRHVRRGAPLEGGHGEVLPRQDRVGESEHPRPGVPRNRGTGAESRAPRTSWNRGRSCDGRG